MKLTILAIDYLYALYLKLVSYFIRPRHYIEGIESPSGTVILIPGVYENGFYFSKLSRRLEDAGYAVINAELLTGQQPVVASAKCINSYINDKGLKNVILIGHSSGGLIAVACLDLNRQVIKKAIAIAAPFSGVYNGHLLRTKLVKELLPSSELILSINKLSQSPMQSKVISIFPRFDNQVWHHQGSKFAGATNIELTASGHHLVLNSHELSDIIIESIV